MTPRGRQARFVFATVACWAGARAALLWAGGSTTPGLLAERGPVPVVPAAGPIAIARSSASAGRAPAPDHGTHALVARAALPPAPAAGPGHSAVFAPAMLLPALAEQPPPSLAGSAPPVALIAVADLAPLPSAALARPAADASRLSASAYLFLRPGSGRASLAAGGELGGSQAAARFAYRLNDTGPVRVAAVARVYAPLATKGAEAAVGIDVTPILEVPLRFSIERRIALDGNGRHAWSAYAAGGFYLERLGGRVAIDGYGQGGVVGAERHDLFADGALRVGRRWRIGPATATLGAGLWGAAQPDAARLDVGPRVAAVLPIAQHDVSVALEGRLRVAGQASPGSGAALTLGFDL